MVRQWLSTDLMAFHAVRFCLEKQFNEHQIAEYLQAVVHVTLEDGRMPANFVPEKVDWDAIAFDATGLWFKAAQREIIAQAFD